MLLKFLKLEIDDYKKLFEFLDKHRMFKIQIYNKNVVFKIRLIELIKENFLRIQYDLTNEYNILNYTSILSLKSNVIFFQIDSRLYSIFSKFLIQLELILREFRIKVKFESLIIDREKLWNFIKNSDQILSLEIMTEKGLIEVSEDNFKDFSNFKFEIEKYPISWAQLVIKTNGTRFQLHFFINEVNVPDNLSINEVTDFFEYLEEYI